jgi:hypothetical protein
MVVAFVEVSSLVSAVWEVVQKQVWESCVQKSFMFWPQGKILMTLKQAHHTKCAFVLMVCLQWDQYHGCELVHLNVWYFIQVCDM